MVIFNILWRFRNKPLALHEIKIYYYTVMKRLFFTACLVFLFAGGGSAEIDSDMDFLPQSVATSTNISAGFVNPAGLGFGLVMALRYMHSYYDSTFKGDNGLMLASRGNLVSIQWLKHTTGISRRKYLLAAGKRMFPDFYWGLSYAWFSSSNELYKKKKVWKLGFLYYPMPQISVGFVIDDLNSPKFGVRKLDRLYTIGAAVRLLNNNVIFSMDSRLREKDDFDEIESMFRLEFTASKKINLVAHYRTEGIIQVGMILQIDHLGIGFGARFSEKNYRGGNIFYNQEPMKSDY